MNALQTEEGRLILDLQTALTPFMRLDIADLNAPPNYILYRANGTCFDVADVYKAREAFEASRQAIPTRCWSCGTPTETMSHRKWFCPVHPIADIPEDCGVPPEKRGVAKSAPAIPLDFGGPVGKLSEVNAPSLSSAATS